MLQNANLPDQEPYSLGVRALVGLPAPSVAALLQIRQITHDDAFEAESAQTHPAGLLFGTPWGSPFAAQPVKTQEVARYIQKRDYRSLALLIPKMQEALQAQDERRTVGLVFIRFGESAIPSIASARLNTLLALGQAGSALYELLCQEPTKKLFLAQNGSDILTAVREDAFDAFVNANQGISSLVDGLRGFATASLQDPYLRNDPMFQQPHRISPALQQQLAYHESLLNWPHHESVHGPLSNHPANVVTFQCWETWRQTIFLKFSSYIGPHMAKCIGEHTQLKVSGDGHAKQDAE